ncbi:hypothetical protein GEMRC1_005219 [Eukaryota sp. GEM-RC1]
MYISPYSSSWPLLQGQSPPVVGGSSTSTWSQTQTYSSSSSSVITHLLPTFHNPSLHRVIPFARAVRDLKHTYGRVYSFLFLHLLILSTSLLPLLIVSFMALPLYLSTGIESSLFISSSVISLSLCFILPCCLIVTCMKPSESDHTYRDHGNMKSLETFNSLFSYNWTHTAKLDVTYAQTMVYQELQQVLDHDTSSNPSDMKNLKVDWIILFFCEWIPSFSSGLSCFSISPFRWLR